MNRANAILLLLGLTILILWIYLSELRNNLYLDGDKYSQYKKNTKELRLQNELLEEELLLKSSYTYIYDQAIKRGFVNAKILILD